MKKHGLILNIVTLAGLVVMVYFFFFKNTGIVYIDTNVLLEKYEGMKVARAEYEGKAKLWQANVDTLFADLDRDVRLYEKERSKMSKKEQELKEELLRNKQGQLSQYQEAMRQKAKEEEQKLTQTALNTVNDYIKEYGKKHNCKYILGANGSGNIVYAQETQNITDEILKGLNEEYMKGKGGK